MHARGFNQSCAAKRSSAVAKISNNLPPLGCGEAIAKNERYIQSSVRIQSTEILAGSSFNWGRGIDRRTPVRSRSSREFAGIRIQFDPPGSSKCAARYTIGKSQWRRFAIQRQPQEDTRFREVPESVSFLLRYPSEVLASCECSFGTDRSSSYQVLCANGAIQMNPAYSYSGRRLSTTSLKDGTPSRTELFIEPINQFAAEMDAFSRCVLENKPVPTLREMGLLDMRIVLAVIESARRGGMPVRI